MLSYKNGIKISSASCVLFNIFYMIAMMYNFVNVVELSVFEIVLSILTTGVMCNGITYSAKLFKCEISSTLSDIIYPWAYLTITEIIFLGMEVSYKLSLDNRTGVDNFILISILVVYGYKLGCIIYMGLLEMHLNYYFITALEATNISQSEKSSVESIQHESSTSSIMTIQSLITNETCIESNDENDENDENDKNNENNDKSIDEDNDEKHKEIMKFEENNVAMIDAIINTNSNEDTTNNCDICREDIAHHNFL